MNDTSTKRQGHQGPNKGFVSTVDNPGNSPLMQWIQRHVGYQEDWCLIWPFGRTKDGYGNIGRNGKCIGAHRYMCTLAKGEPPTPKHEAAHSCGRGHLGCVNPKHLSWKTREENQRDKREHGTHGRSWKLTPDIVFEIRAAKEIELSSVTASRLGLNESTVRQIQSGKIRPQSRDKAMLTPEAILEIRSLRGKRMGTQLAARYGVSTSFIHRIQKGLTYKEVTSPSISPERED